MNAVSIEVHAGAVKVVRVDNDSAVVKPEGAPYQLDVPADVILNWSEVLAGGAGRTCWLVVPKRYALRTNVFMSGYSTVITQVIESPGAA